MNPRYDAIVIGAGIGGLAAAALLSARGNRVLLCEASDKLGGFQHRFEKNGFIIEPHFHFLQDAGPGRPVRKLLRSLGIEPEFIRLDPIAQFQFPGRTITMGNERAEFIAQLVAAFPAEAAGITELFAAMSAIYGAITRQQASTLIGLHAADTVETFVSRFVRDPDLKAIVSAWSAYFGYGSAQIAALAIIVFTEACWDGGIHHPVGGITTIIRALEQRIKSGGGVVRTSAPVRRIRIEDGHACGVELEDGSPINAPIVVSNVDAASTFRDFLSAEPVAVEPRERLESLRPFRSPFCVYLGVRADGLDLRQGAAVRVLFESPDLTAQDQAQIAGDVEHAPLSLGIPTLLNPGLAPENHHILMLYTFIPGERMDALLANPQSARDYALRLLRRADRDIPGLQDSVVLMETSLSANAHLYAPNTRGAIGWEPAPNQLPLMPDHATDIPGLYLVGQWTRTGGGMNNVFASAHLAVQMIAEAVVG